jgi:hypothetical protein
MKTPYGQYAELWHTELPALKCLLDPLAFCPRPKYILHTAQTHPISKQSAFTARKLPRLVPNFNQQARVNLQPGKHMRALIFAMKANFDSHFCNFTFDDFLVVLDSGCSIMITLDIGDFIHGTYTPQEHNTRGTSSGLNSQGIDNVNWKFHDVNGKMVTL